MESISMVDMTIVPIDPVDLGLSSSEKPKPIGTVKPRKKSMTSVFLKFFETAPDRKSRRFKFYGQSYSIATATGNLGKHFGNRHPGYNNKSGENAEAVTIAKKPHQAQAKTPLAAVDYDHLNWLLVKWLVSASLPPSMLEEKWLANSYRFLNPSIQLWPGERYRAVFHEVLRGMQGGG